jgi:hypothetical protein
VIAHMGVGDKRDASQERGRRGGAPTCSALKHVPFNSKAIHGIRGGRVSCDGSVPFTLIILIVGYNMVSCKR